MGINLTQISQMLDIEGDNIRLSANAYEKANQGSDQLDHEPDKIDVLDEGISVPKKVHQFYFVNFWPHQEPSSESEIEKAERVIRKLNHEELQIRKRQRNRVISKMGIDANVAAQPHMQEDEHSRRLGRTQGPQSRDPLSLPSEPITRLRAKRFKEALNELIQYVGEMTNTWRPDISLNQIQGSLITMVKILEESN